MTNMNDGKFNIYSNQDYEDPYIFIKPATGFNLNIEANEITSNIFNTVTNTVTEIITSSIEAPLNGTLSITATGINADSLSASLVESYDVNATNVKASSISAPEGQTLDLTVNTLGANTVNTTTLNTTGKATFTNQSTDVAKINFQAGTQADFSITDTNGWIDVNVPIVSRGTGANNPTISAIVGLTGMEVYTFVGSGGGASMRQVWGIIHIPHDYCPNTGIYLHAHVLTDTATLTGNYKLNFDYTYASGDGVFSAVQTVSVIDSFQSKLQHKISEISVPILTSGLEVDGVIMVRMWRDHIDVQDTFAGEVHLMFIDAHIQVSKFSTKHRNKATGSFYI